MYESTKPVTTTAYMGQNYPISQPPETPAAGHIHSEMQEHDRLLHALNDEIAVLAERINPVLRASVPSPSSTGVGTPAPSKSGLACSLSECNDRLLNSIGRVRDLAARADL